MTTLKGVVNMKIDWKTKLSSRKFWVTLVGFITPTLLAFGATESTASQVAAIIMAGGAVIAYILSEGMVDAGRNSDKDDKGDEDDET